MFGSLPRKLKDEKSRKVRNVDALNDENSVLVSKTNLVRIIQTAQDHFNMETQKKLQVIKSHPNRIF